VSNGGGEREIHHFFGIHAEEYQGTLGGHAQQ
jgi:hypothetical protein